jgi:EF hand
MKSRRFFAIAALAAASLALSACGQRAAQSPTQTPSAPARAPAAPSGLAPTMTLQEYQARFREHMLRIDTDHDGRISLKEWLAWRAGRPGRGDPTKEFEKYDLNHDGFITADELDAVAARKFARRQAETAGPAANTAAPTDKAAGAAD